MGWMRILVAFAMLSGFSMGYSTKAFAQEILSDDEMMAEILAGDDDDDDGAEGEDGEDGADEDDGGDQDEDDAGPSYLDDLWSRLEDDPTLGGKLSLTYRATYSGKFYDFGPYRFPIADPAFISEFDALHASQLSARRSTNQDHDLDQYLAWGWRDIYQTDEEESGLIDSVSAQLSLRFYADLDGSDEGDESLDTINTFSSDSQFRLLTGQATIEAFRRHLELTLGRQYDREAEWIHFDGAKARLRGFTLFGQRAEVTAFGGSRVKFFRRTVAAQDGIFGGNFKYWLFRDTRVRVSAVQYIDTSIEAELRQSLGGWGWASIGYRQIDADPSLARVEADLRWPEQNLSLYLRSVHLLGRTGNDFPYDFTRSPRDPSETPMYFHLGDLALYDEVTAEVRKGFLDFYGAGVGGMVHRLRERDLQDGYNTDWQEVWISADWSHAPWKGFTGRTSLRYLNTDLPRRPLRLDPEFALTNGTPDFRPEDITGDGEPSFIGADLLLEQNFQRYVALGLTVDFRSYAYQSNYLELESLRLSNVSTYFRWRATSRMQWSLRYSFTRDYRYVNPDLNALHSVQLQFSYQL